ncbi:MAG: autotransporter outer membrane beta-barrel domain-containing protein [Cetobacterium somerae]|uniref:autotransporter outer membrane beta-barrel domain-containing protein n=1 Tax=Cetobacterium somerae TaxID=188913 RepID=UPI003F381497
MKKLNTIKQILKRSLKRKIKITESLLVIFLITGGVTHSFTIVGDINQNRDIVDENKFTEFNSTIIENGIGFVGDANEINTKKNGVIIKSENSKIWNISKIENGEDYGMIGINGGIGINFGSKWKVTEFDGIKDSISGEKGIFNKGNYGMGAVSTEADKSSILSNHGLIKNNGKYGMYIEANGINTEVFAENKGYKITYSELGYILNENQTLIDSYENIEDTNKYYEKINESLDGIANSNNYGMAGLAVNGGVSNQKNYGLIENMGDYGIVAQSIGSNSNSKVENIGGEENIFYTLKTGEQEGQALFYKNQNGIKNNGKYGMSILAQENGQAEGVNTINLQKINQGCTLDSKNSICQDPDKPFIQEPILGIGLVENNGDIGMIGIALEKGESLLINEGIDISYKSNYLEDENIKISIELKGGVKNQGDYGMVALTDDKSKSEAINRGLIVNTGDYGMYSEGKGSFIENTGFSINLNTFFKIEGGIRNEGNYGMSVNKNGSLLNKGLISNQGDYGIYILNNSKGENRGRDIIGEELLNIFGLLSKNKEELKKLTNNNLEELFSKFILDYADDKLLEEIKKINIEGGIKNEGNIGVYVGNNSYFINHGVINPAGITKTEEGEILLEILGFGKNDKVAIVGGEGHNTITLGTGSQISGKVSGGLGDNTLHFIDTYDEYTGKLIENNIYGEIVPKSFAHIIFGKNVVDKDDNGNLVFDNDRTLSESVWRISDEIVLDYHKNTNKNDYTAIVKNGKSTITTDKFNGIYINGVFLERDGEDREKIKELLKGNVIFEEGSSLVKHVGKNVTSTLAANSINMNGGKITQRVLDNLFVTNANRIEITNIFTSGLSEQQKREIEEKGLLINGEQASGSIKLPEEYFKVESIGKGDISGWNSWHEYNPLTGDVTLIFERIPIKPVNPEIPDKDNLGLQGGYAQSIDKYTQSNVDIINTMYIKNQGHNYARKIAFIPKVQSIINQQIIYPEYISDKGRTHKLGKENILSPVAEIVEVENGEAYDSLQIAEIFGDYGKYTGDSSSKFNYDTWGITGGTFHRFNEQWLSGLTYGYAKSKVDYKTGEGGKENIDTIGLNLFLAYEKNNWLSINSFGYSWNKHDLSRKIYDRDSEVLGKWPIQTMTADFDSHLISIGTELGYRYLINEESYLYPYIGLDYIWYTRESYKESGDSYALDIDASKLNTLISKIGLIYEKTWNKISGFGDIGWQHYFSNFKSFNGKFYNESLTQYEIEGLDIGKDVGYIRVGLEYNFTNEVTTGLDYTATFRKDEISNKVGVNIQYKW